MNPIGSVNNETKSRAHKKNNFLNKPKLPTIFQHENA